MYSILTDSAFADSTNIAGVLDSALLAPTGPAYTVLSIPDSVREYDMASPVGVAIRDGGSCLIATTGSRDENAVYYFSSPATYLGSRFLGAKRGEALSSLGKLSLARDGSALIGEMGRRRIAEIAPDRKQVRVFQSQALATETPYLPAVIRVRPNRLLENWMSGALGQESSTWGPAELPIVRVIDTLGVPVGGLWRVSGRPGKTMTSVVNSGVMAVRGDTVWFGYRVSGQIVRGVVDSRDSIVRVTDTSRIVLPRMYAPVYPQTFKSNADTIGFAQVEDQITALAVAGAGQIIVGQTISYPPRGSRALHQPTTAVVLYDSAGKFIRGWRVGGGWVRDIAVGEGVLAVIVYTDSAARQFEVRVHRMPELQPASARPGKCAAAMPAALAHGAAPAPLAAR